MPSIAEATVSPLSRLKRRREDASSGIEMQTKLASPLQLLRHPQAPEPSPILSADPRDELQSLERRQVHPRSRPLHDSKRQRLSLDASYLLEHGPSNTRAPSLIVGNIEARNTPNIVERAEPMKDGRPRVDLSPCHICHRKPTIKSELDQYAYCEGCGKRTCYICIRECLGSMLGSPILSDSRYDIEGDYDVLDLSFHKQDDVHDVRNLSAKLDGGYGGCDRDVHAAGSWEKERRKKHQRMVCSGCCVERGTEGEVWCLGCLMAETGT